MTSPVPLLFTPIELRGVRVRNRTVISPMCQYSAVNGLLQDWHFVHLGKFATGGAGIVFVESTAVEPRGLITHGCPGLWDDTQMPGHQQVTAFLRAQGAVSVLQLAHAGRKGSAQRPWEGGGPLGAAEASRGEAPWPTVAPSAIPFAEGWPVPHELTTSEIADVVAAYVAATERALKAGYDSVEIHGAHGYLMNTFLSPVSNRRTDAYGGDRTQRMRFTLEVTEAVRAVWPDDRPLFFRVSAVDWLDGGWNLEDSVALARELKVHGVDVVDCSSGGVGAMSLKRKAGFQVPFAETIRHEADIMTEAVGLITDPHQAEEILRRGQADFIAIAREALVNPNWPFYAATALGFDPGFENWPEAYGWHLERRARFAEFYQPKSN